MKLLFLETKVKIPETVPIELDFIIWINHQKKLQKYNYYIPAHQCFTEQKKVEKVMKSRLPLLKITNSHVKEVTTIKFYYANFNCCLKVKFNHGSQKDLSFSSFDDLCDIVDTFDLRLKNFNL